MEFKLHELSHTYPLSCDFDPVNKKAREIVYNKKRDLLLKLASVNLFDDFGNLVHRLEPPSGMAFHYTEWNLKKDNDAEDMPDKVINAIKFAKLAAKEHIPFLARFQ